MGVLDGRFTLTPVDYAVRLLSILSRDRESRLLKIERYISGQHDQPYMPDRADAEYRLLARRAITNAMPLAVGTPAQNLRVDGYRRGEDQADRLVSAGEVTPEWQHFKRSRLDARQASIYRGALTYGHAFTVTLRERGKPVTRALSPLRTTAIFHDAANDDAPLAMLTVLSFPNGEQSGVATLWDDLYEYPVSFKSLTDAKGTHVGTGVRHGSSECPGTRFAIDVDLEGNTTGLVWPLIPIQDRINQSVFDLLVDQTYNSFQVRAITGMAPPMRMVPQYEDPDDITSPVIGVEPYMNPVTGMPEAQDINMNPKRWFYAEDPDTKFTSLPGTPMDGFISSIEMSLRQFSAFSHTPPHYLLGQIANLSAEALQAAEISLSRQVGELKSIFGEAWERVFRLAAQLAGEASAADDFGAEVVWYDSEGRSLSATADALNKLKDLGIPVRGLWRRVPQVTATELADWEEMADQSDSTLQLAKSMSSLSGGLNASNVPAGNGTPPATGNGDGAS